MTIRSICIIVFLLALSPGIAAADALSCDFELKSDGFTICHDERYPQDAEFAREVLDRATTRFRARYGVQGTFTTVYQVGEPTSVDCGGHQIRIQPGSALNCGGDRVYLMSRSAPEMNRCCTQLGFHFQSDEYYVTVLTHEYSTAFQHNFPSFYSKPRWFYDGLEQYEGFFAVGRPNVWRLAAEKTYNDNAISCGQGLMGEALTITEPYAAGATYFRYLADRFGEQIHIDMIRDGRADASQILADLIEESPCETFEHFRTWMIDEFGLGGPTSDPVPVIPWSGMSLLAILLLAAGTVRLEQSRRLASLRGERFIGVA